MTSEDFTDEELALVADTAKSLKGTLFDKYLQQEILTILKRDAKAIHDHKSPENDKNYAIGLHDAYTYAKLVVGHMEKSASEDLTRRQKHARNRRKDTAR